MGRHSDFAFVWPPPPSPPLYIADMNFLRRTPLSGVRTLFVRGHGPTHGPDGRLLGQGIGTTFPFSTAETAKKKYHTGRAVWGYFVVGVVAPCWAVWFSANKEAK